MVDLVKLYPRLLGYSLETWVIPRYKVVDAYANAESWRNMLIPKPNPPRFSRIFTTVGNLES